MNRPNSSSYPENLNRDYPGKHEMATNFQEDQAVNLLKYKFQNWLTKRWFP